MAKTKKKRTKTRTAKKKATKKKVSKRKPVKAKVKKKKKKTAETEKKAAKRKPKVKKIKKKPQKRLKKAKKSQKSKEFEEIERMLLNRRAELLRLISKSSTAEKDISKLERGDLEDMAATSLEREMTFAIGSREREEYRMINGALKKITSKTYAICEGCGEKINIKRLKIVPFAQYCMECKSSMEQEILPDKENFFK